MSALVSICIEKKIEKSSIAPFFDGAAAELLFTKGPDFKKTMGLFSVPYAQAVSGRWNCCVIKNPPEISPHVKKALLDIVRHVHRKAYGAAACVPVPPV